MLIRGLNLAGLLRKDPPPDPQLNEAKAEPRLPQRGSFFVDSDTSGLFESLCLQKHIGGNAMRYLIALFCPWVVFFSMGKVLQGFLCLFLQLTIFGWLPATIWAFASIGGYHADKRTDRIVNAINPQPAAADPRRI
jgi:uncharacterized membrane protein YqaE (UPF0057 family)